MVSCRRAASTWIVVTWSAILLSFDARADKWEPPPNESTNYKFGDLNCVHRQLNPNQTLYPDYSFSCSRAGRELFAKKGYGAELVRASPDNKYIAGFSNYGLQPFAYWIIDFAGKTLAEQKHGGRESLGFYCSRTVTVGRKWFDAEAPNVKFFEIGGRLIDVAIRNCSHRMISINQLTPFSGDLSASDKARYEKHLRDWEAVSVASIQRLAAASEKEARSVGFAKALKLAIAQGDLKSVRAILDDGLDPNTLEGGTYPVFVAVEEHKNEAFELLVSHGAKVEVEKPSGENLLGIAAYYGNLELVKRIVALGVRVDAPERSWKWTPLMRAANKGHLEVVRFLLKAGASTKAQDKDGKNALAHAMDNHHEAIVSLLGSADGK